ncbi:MAG: SAM-dependent methyltransferase [Clostridia bacterium]|nr:SAM-dependent methyltransferase [Clostridia bacterium]
MNRNSYWERKLNISTAAASHEKEDRNHSRYEPTDYGVLERLAESGFIGKENCLVDYGCGKGRVGFFLSYVLGIRTIGVEYDENLYREALENLSGYSGRKSAGHVSFVCENAEGFVPSGADRFYFFNPFSVTLLRTVIRRITDEYFADPREMYLFFYYALDAYRVHLMGENCLEFVEEIDCRDLFHNDDPLERILVFKVTAGY